MTIREESIFWLVMVVAFYVMGWASGPLLGRYLSYGLGAAAVAILGVAHIGWRKYRAR
jgi:hypothetical protein